MFTEQGSPIRHPDSRYARYNLKRRKSKVVRPMLCTDIELNDGVPEAVFIEAWNRLVTLRHRYVGRWQRLLEIGDVLTRYRVRELMRLTGNGNKLASTRRRTGPVNRRVLASLSRQDRCAVSGGDEGGY